MILLQAVRQSSRLVKPQHHVLNPCSTPFQRSFHVSASCNKIQAARYRPTRKRNKPITYEMACPPNLIGEQKSFKSWNTSNILDGHRRSECAVEDAFIRKFVIGTFHNLFVSDIIIKRRQNIIYIAGIATASLQARRMYFLIGYTEEILSYIVKCPVKLEINTVNDKKDVVYEYI